MDGTPRCHGGRRESRQREAEQYPDEHGDNIDNVNCNGEESNEFLRIDGFTKDTNPEVNVDEPCDGNSLRTNKMMEDEF